MTQTFPAVQIFPFCIAFAFSSRDAELPEFPHAFNAKHTSFDVSNYARGLTPAG